MNYLIDNFNGDGPLYSHAGDTGHTWVHLTGWVGGNGDIVDGQLTLAASSNLWHGGATTAVIPAEASYEIGYYVLAADTGWQMESAIRTQADNTSYYLDLYASVGGRTLVSFYDAAGTALMNEVDVGPNTTGPHTIRVDMGADKVVIYDGAEVGRFTENSQPAAGKFYVAIQDSLSHQGILLDSVKVFTLGGTASDVVVPASGTVLIRDTFDGAAGTTASPGNLYAHTANTGQVWNVGNNAKSLNLDGAGGVVPGMWGDNGLYCDAIALFPMPFPDYFVEVDVDIPANDDDSSVWTILRCRDQPAPTGVLNSNYCDIYWTPNDVGYSPTINWGLSGNGFGVASPSTGFAAMSGVHTFRTEVEGTTVRAYIDGVLIDSRPITANLPAAGYVGFGMQYRNADGNPPRIRALEFRAGMLGALASLFWTDVIGATET